MPKYVKVGVDQWAIATIASGTELLTEGLSGCVALALISDSRFALAHVSSDCDDSNKAAYLVQLQLLFSRMGTVQKAILTCNQSPGATGPVGWLPRFLTNWLASNGVKNVQQYQDTGCRVLNDAMGCGVVTINEDDDRDDYTRGYLTVSGANGAAEAVGTLSPKSRDTGLPDNE